MAMALREAASRPRRRDEARLYFRARLIDHYGVLTIRENGRERPLQPFKRAEDWSVLHKEVLSRTYPMQAAPHLRMKIMNTSVDTGGLDHATNNAYEWWYAMMRGDVGSGRPPLQPEHITLLKGGNNPKGKLLPDPTPDTKRYVDGASMAELYVPNVHRYKNIAEERLKRSEDGPGYINFPNDLPEEVDSRTGELIIPYIAEFRAETLIDDQWTREEHRANESWDLYIQACTVVTRFGGRDASLSWVPYWALPPKATKRSLPAPVMSADRAEAAAGSGEAAPVQRAAGRVPSRPVRRRGVRMVRPR